MRHIVIAWELGGYLGHMFRILPIATRLRDAGYKVSFILGDLSRVEPVIGKMGFDVVQAPVWLPKARKLPDPPVSYAEILQHFGYLSEPGLMGLVKGWRKLFEWMQPDLVLFDYAPTALLASHNLNFPRAIIGTGFFTPPPIHPTPNMRPWVEVSQKRLELADKKVLHVINRVLDQFFPTTKIENLYELFQCEENFFTTFAELDPYAYQRPKDTRYWGPVFSQSTGKQPIWSEGDSKKIFAYLKPEYGNCEAVLQALSESVANTLVFSLNLPQEWVERYQSATIVFSREPFSMSQVMDECDATVCHAGHDTIASALLAERPMLLLPTQLEQILLSKSVEKMGMGIICGIDENASEIQRKFQKLIAGMCSSTSSAGANNNIPNKAKGLSDTDRTRDMNKTIERIVIRCSELVAH